MAARVARETISVNSGAGVLMDDIMCIDAHKPQALMHSAMHTPYVHKPGMSYNREAIEYLRHVIDVTGKTPTALAKMVQKAPTTFTRPLAQSADWKFGIRFATLQELAEKTGVPLPASLLASETEADAAPTPTHEVRLPIRYEVAASGFVPRDELADEPVGFQTVPSIKGYERHEQWLERVISDSMDRILPVGCLIHVIDAHSLRYRPRHGDIVVVERERRDGSLVERTVKQISVEGDVVELWPRSHNPRWHRAVELRDGTETDEEFTVQIVGRVMQSYMFFEAD